MAVLRAAGDGDKVTVTVWVTSRVEVTVDVAWVVPPPQPARTIAARAIAALLDCIEGG
jgi:hypothetical protein